MADQDSDGGTDSPPGQGQGPPDADDGDRSDDLERRAKELADTVRRGPLPSSDGEEMSETDTSDSDPGRNLETDDPASKAKKLKETVKRGSDQDSTVASVKESLSPEEGPPPSRHEQPEDEDDEEATKEKVAQNLERIRDQLTEQDDREPSDNEAAPLTRDSVKEAAVGTSRDGNETAPGAEPSGTRPDDGPRPGRTDDQTGEEPVQATGRFSQQDTSGETDTTTASGRTDTSGGPPQDEPPMDGKGRSASSSESASGRQDEGLDPDTEPHAVPPGAGPQPPEGQKKVDLEEDEEDIQEVTEDDLVDIRKDIVQVKKVVNNLSEWVQSIQDREVLEELKEMGLEERLDVMEETLQYVDSNKQRDRLRKLQRIFDEWDESKLPQKVDYLYKQYRTLEDEVEGSSSLEQQVHDLEERLEELDESIETMGPSDEVEQELEDHEEKLFTLRDRIEEVKDMAKESGGLSDADREELKESLIEELREDLHAELEDEIPGMIREAVQEMDEDELGIDIDAVDALESRVNSLESDVESGMDLSSVDASTRDEIIHEVAKEVPESKMKEFESRIDRLEMNMPADLDEMGSPEEIGELKAKLNRAMKLQDRVSDLEEGQSELSERLGDTEAVQKEVSDLQDRQEELMDDLDDWIETVEHREEQFDSKLAQLDQELSTEVESLRQELLDSMGEKHAEINDRLDRLETGFDDMKEDFIEDQVDMQDSVDEMEEDFRRIVSEFRQLEDQIYEMSDAVRYALKQAAEAKGQD